MTSAAELDSLGTRDTGYVLSRPWLLPDQRGRHRVVTVPISALLPSDSPRLDGENTEHARALAESDAAFPPIIVHRATMRVIDGMHRLSAAGFRGQQQIDVQFFDGDDRDAFVLAVEANIAHGLPLSLADRTAAVARILRSHPEWSDRAIASTAGVTAKTVGAMRRRSTEESHQSNVRVGRDGRVRPLNVAEGRRLAGALMKEQPAASLRKIAKAAGISVGTAHDVRERLRRGEDPVPPRQHEGSVRARRDELASRRAGRTARRRSVHDRASIVRRLSRDPSLRFADAGRMLLRLLHPLTIGPKEWRILVNNLPTHCTPLVVEAARAYADAWQEFAEQLERR